MSRTSLMRSGKSGRKRSLNLSLAEMNSAIGVPTRAYALNIMIPKPAQRSLRS